MYRQTTSDELYHYGVKGMKWGVRRATKRLNLANASGSKQDHNKAVTSLRKHRDKATNEIKRLDAKNEKLQKERYKSITKSNPKIAKYNKKATKYRQKASTSFIPIRERSLTIKANKLDVKVSKLEQKAAKIRARIEKNERLKRTFERGLNEIDKELTDKGRDFLYDLVED